MLKKRSVLWSCAAVALALVCQHEAQAFGFGFGGGEEVDHDHDDHEHADFYEGMEEATHLTFFDMWRRMEGLPICTCQ